MRNFDQSNTLPEFDLELFIHIVLSVLDVRAYSVSFSASLDMNQLPEKLYLGQNLKQYVMKEAVIYKILRYRQNRCHTNEERWTDHSWHKAKIQHPQQCQSIFTIESQDNIPDCTKTHIIKTALPISLPGVKETLFSLADVLSGSTCDSSSFFHHSPSKTDVSWNRLT